MHNNRQGWKVVGSKNCWHQLRFLKVAGGGQHSNRACRTNKTVFCALTAHTLGSNGGSVLGQKERHHKGTGKQIQYTKRQGRALLQKEEAGANLEVERTGGEGGWLNM